MRKLLLQLDTSPNASVFDRVVAYDGGADDVMSYSGVTEATVRELVHGAIFTRGPKDLHNTAIFIGGTDMAAGERLLATVRETFFGPLRVSVMLDSNGSNYGRRRSGQTAAGRRARSPPVVAAATGPGGMRAAGLGSSGRQGHGHLARPQGPASSSKTSSDGSAAMCSHRDTDGRRPPESSRAASASARAALASA